MKMKPFTSYSGDAYLIPEDQYEADVKAYNEALNRGDDKAMINFEAGFTGWVYNEEIG